MRLEGQERDIWNWFVAVQVNLAALGIKEYFLEDTIIMCGIYAFITSCDNFGIFLDSLFSPFVVPRVHI